ncbi:MAG: glycosyltransferase family 2 protein [Muribaculaceae bacterium]|nr:glycosyltransferase family 2 protein [Muribaculaceae bacterium]
MKTGISVIVPVWNRANLIKRCLDSILNQSEKPEEIIVVDNNSTDKTASVVEEWINENQDSGISLKLLKEEKAGACFARQKGLENATGEYVIFFDSDDEMKSTLIENVNEALAKSPESDIVCWKCRIHLLDGGKRIPPFMADKPLEAHLIHTLLRPQGHAVRKDFLNNAGGWKKPAKVWDDFELGLRLLLNNPKITPINKVLAEIYAQEVSITGTDFSSKEGEWEEILWEMERVVADRDDANVSKVGSKKRIAKILDYRKAILAAHYYRERNKASSKKLMKEVLKDKSIYQSLVLRFSYYYTRSGFRGAWRIVSWFI